MITSGFWDNVLEQDENLLWAGRPMPRLHWRNWRLYGQAPMAAIGLMAAAWFIISTYGAEGDMWLLALPALLVYIPARATAQQLRAFGATRYALTDKRVLYFQILNQGTRVKAHPHSAMIPPKVMETSPPSVSFLRYGSEKKNEIGFDYIEGLDDLLPILRSAA